ncbi:MAG: RNA polymerase sigma factor, partial [Planctomycetaceae bacterium]
MPADEVDRLLVARIRAGDASAWQECIARFEGRLLAFVDSRLRDHAASEDVVQETFLGFLTALPNYHDDTPLESFLFAIAAHKLTDHLLRQGRRPALP